MFIATLWNVFDQFNVIDLALEFGLLRPPWDVRTRMSVELDPRIPLSILRDFLGTFQKTAPAVGSMSPPQQGM
jgi:hypothetical protein